MTIEELINFGKSHIHKTQAEMLLACLLNVNTLELLLMLDKVIDDNVCNDYKEKILLIKENKPIQYVIGNVNFFGKLFKVNKSVLIPRFETEYLVENTILYIKKYFSLPIKIIDLGTGSGVIGLTLKDKLQNVDVTLLDISHDALLVAKENAHNLNLDVHLIESDMWSNVSEKFDVVVSNPPYIRNNEEIEDIVRENEPHLALYGGDDGLFLYRKIRDGLLEHTNNKFLLALEIGDMQKDDVMKLFSDIPDVKIIAKCDLQGRDRMIFVFKNIEIDDDTICNV